MTRHIFTSLVLTLVACGLAACNAGSLLTTGSLTGKKAAPAAPKPATPIDRALHVAATSARAYRCGFYFDRAALRTNFLTAETTRGTPLETVTKAGQSYQFTETRVAASIKDSATYCTKVRTTSIKKNLQQALAGNFEPPVKKAVAQQGIASLLEQDSAPKPFNKEAVFDPSQRR